MLCVLLFFPQIPVGCIRVVPMFFDAPYHHEGQKFGKDPCHDVTGRDLCLFVQAVRRRTALCDVSDKQVKSRHDFFAIHMLFQGFAVQHGAAAQYKAALPGKMILLREQPEAGKPMPVCVDIRHAAVDDAVQLLPGETAA